VIGGIQTRGQNGHQELLSPFLPGKPKQFCWIFYACVSCLLNIYSVRKRRGGHGFCSHVASLCSTPGLLILALAASSNWLIKLLDTWNRNIQQHRGKKQILLSEVRLCNAPVLKMKKKERKKENLATFHWSSGKMWTKLKHMRMFHNCVALQWMRACCYMNVARAQKIIVGKSR
jgi:hypothetical protein